MKLDFRFADEDDAEELITVINDSYAIECADSPALIQGLEFRKNTPKIHLHEVSTSSF